MCLPCGKRRLTKGEFGRERPRNPPCLPSLIPLLNLLCDKESRSDLQSMLNE